MRTLAAISLVLAVTGLMASAMPPWPPPPTGEMKLTLDLAGNATLTNITSSPLEVDSYEIWSLSDGLSPTGWESIHDAAATRPQDVIDELGAGALTFQEWSAEVFFLSEFSLVNRAMFQPGAPWSIGRPALAPPSVDAFYYSKPDWPGDKFLGVVEVIPEPATLGLLALGGLALLRRRRKRIAG